MVEKHDLDRTDIEILRLLQNNARLSVKVIASHIGLAASSTHERIKKLWDEGILLGAHAEVDPVAFGAGLEALLMIGFSKHKRSNVDRFLSEVTDIPEVCSAFLVTGRYDVIVHVLARSTTHLKDLAFDQFTSRPGVTRIETSIIYEHRKQHVVPLLVE